jgi:hypothetical protein
VSAVLRCLSSIELYENAQHYSSHPTVKLLHEKGAFTSIKNAFAMCLSDSALSVFETQSLVAAVIEEAQLNAQNFKFSSMMCMFALATVINCRIESYYPVGKDLSPREEWDSLEKMFNCTFSQSITVMVSILRVFTFFVVLLCLRSILLIDMFRQLRIILLPCVSLPTISN